MASLPTNEHPLDIRNLFFLGEKTKTRHVFNICNEPDKPDQLSNSKYGETKMKEDVAINN